MTIAQKRFIGSVFDYGLSRENCMAFQNIHITEEQKNAICKAWAEVEKGIKHGASDSELDKIALAFWDDYH